MDIEDSINFQANTFFNRSLDSLSHYGVQGMKWGVRNEETLRKYAGPKGRSRVSGEKTRIKRRQKYMDRFRSNSSHTRKEKKLTTYDKPSKDSDPRNLSDQELLDANNRMQNEITYHQRKQQLRNYNLTPSERVSKNLSKFAIDVGKNVIQNYIQRKANKILDKQFDKVAKATVEVGKDFIYTVKSKRSK